jgi:hypothetical protein
MAFPYQIHGGWDVRRIAGRKKQIKQHYFTDLSKKKFGTLIVRSTAEHIPGVAQIEIKEIPAHDDKIKK